jgi:hypothetical protein
MVVTTDEIEPVIKALGIRALSQAQERRGKGE